uniref:Putative ATPase domain containing protein n=1 Tax=viral metagenome TaxID=1070528 RepID=A0A6H1ZN92_9ZZZZ
MLISLRGEEKVGKSHFSATAPTPIVVFNLDGGFQRCLGSFPALKTIVVEGKELAEALKTPADIYIVEYYLDFPSLTTIDAKNPFGKGLKISPIYTQFLQNIEMAVRNPAVKTLVFDTGTVWWEIARSAFKEKAGSDGMMARDYGTVNAEVRAVFNFVKAAEKRGMEKNLITLHHNKDIYVADKATGDTMADGCKHVGKFVDVKLRMTKDKKEGKIVTTTEIEDCGLNRTVEGKKLANLTFEKLQELAEL